MERRRRNRAENRAKKIHEHGISVQTQRIGEADGNGLPLHQAPNEQRHEDDEGVDDAGGDGGDGEVVGPDGERLGRPEGGAGGAGGEGAGGGDDVVDVALALGGSAVVGELAHDVAYDCESDPDGGGDPEGAVEVGALLAARAEGGSGVGDGVGHDASGEVAHVPVAVVEEVGGDEGQENVAHSVEDVLGVDVEELLVEFHGPELGGDKIGRLGHHVGRAGLLGIDPLGLLLLLVHVVGGPLRLLVDSRCGVRGESVGRSVILTAAVGRRVVPGVRVGIGSLSIIATSKRIATFLVGI